MAKLAYLFPAFPVFHQTFVLWEVMGVQRNGVSPMIYSLRQPTEQQQPEGRAIMSDVTYLPPVWSAAVIRANWKLLRAGVRRYARLYGAVLKAWWPAAVVPARDRGWEPGSSTFPNRLRGWLNSHPVLYLLKSWWLVPRAVHLAEVLEREGITHLHAHWAS